MTPLLPEAVAVAAWAGLGAYLWAESRLHRRGDRWPVARTAVAAAAVLSASAAALWPVRTLVDEVAVHLLLTMLAPLLLALSAPVSLALRTLPRAPRRVLLALLHSRWARAVTWAPVVLVLQVGGVAVFWLAPLPHALHGPLMVHMLAAGWLFSTCLVGRDPVPGRPGTLGRAVLLLVAAAAHHVVAKLLYARGGGSGAELLFYGGDAVEVATALVLCAQWYERTRPRPGRDARADVTGGEVGRLRDRRRVPAR
ncbi:cytochrome c oxidase assembly protein [Kineococcus sp. SYSU DK006]|uniref:cytochrome c oxidase assembly protein n=1 Tax=Kineococcus sp. SYSU DK006 TaxID=3383127 RepID=UPI003D7D630B